MADFIYIDGVEYKADKELVDLIKSHANSSLDDSFKRQTKGDGYYYIENDGIVYEATELGYSIIDRRYEIGNYCTDKELLKKRAAEENLLRKMWRFSLTHDGDKIDWNNENTQKWYLGLDSKKGVIISGVYVLRQMGVIYFNSKEAAEEAQKEFGKEFKEVYGNSYKNSY